VVVVRVVVVTGHPMPCDMWSRVMYFRSRPGKVRSR
jgi:hypothetical protein